MAYRFQSDAPLDGDVRRIARAQVEKAVEDLSLTGDAAHEGVHEARKRFKRLRGLLRLVRTADPGFARREEARYRDAGRLLSGARDRTALIEALDGLAEHSGAAADAPGFATVRVALGRRRTQALERAERDADGALETVRASLAEGRSRLDAFAPPRAGGSGRRRILLDGLDRNYRRARADLREARRSGETEAFHDLRKRMKYLGMHLKLLEEAWPGPFAAMRAEADAVADALGRDHDYAVLRAEMLAEPAAFGAAAGRRAVLSAMERHAASLRADALTRTERLLAEKPKAFRRRFGRLLDGARTEFTSEED